MMSLLSFLRWQKLTMKVLSLIGSARKEGDINIHEKSPKVNKNLKAILVITWGWDKKDAYAYRIGYNL